MLARKRVGRIHEELGRESLFGHLRMRNDQNESSHLEKVRHDAKGNAADVNAKLSISMMSQNFLKERKLTLIPSSRLGICGLYSTKLG